MNLIVSVLPITYFKMSFMFVMHFIKMLLLLIKKSELPHVCYELVELPTLNPSIIVISIEIRWFYIDLVESNHRF